jgi:hypothetical protein
MKNDIILTTKGTFGDVKVWKLGKEAPTTVILLVKRTWNMNNMRNVQLFNQIYTRKGCIIDNLIH